jgi:hypothetical protein
MRFFRRRKETRAAREASRAAARSAFAKGLSAAASTLIFGGLAVGVIAGAPRLQQRLAERDAAATVQVAFDWPPSTSNATWLPREVQEQLLTEASNTLEQHPDPFSAEALRRIAETAAGTGWFEEILAVRREAGGVIRLSGRWRIPAAVVRRDGRDYLVSHKGEVLPLSFAADESTLQAITGTQLDPVRAGGRVVPGTIWPGADVRAGLDLLSVIASRPWSNQVAGVDVRDFLGKKQLALVTRAGGRVIWGGAVNEAIPGQVSVEVKLRRLDALVQQFRSIDAGHRIVEIGGPKVLVDETATASAQ